MLEIVRIHREFKEICSRLPAEDQERIRIKGYAVAAQGVLSAVAVIALCIGMYNDLAKSGMNPLIAPTLLAITLLLSYKLLVVLGRKALKG
jgi:hypothetical protein